MSRLGGCSCALMRPPLTTLIFSTRSPECAPRGRAGRRTSSRLSVCIDLPWRKDTQNKLAAAEARAAAAAAAGAEAQASAQAHISGRREAESERLAARQRMAELEGMAARATDAETAAAEARDEAATAQAEVSRMAEVAAAERMQLRQQLEQLSRQQPSHVRLEKLGSPPAAPPPPPPSGGDAAPKLIETRAINAALSEAHDALRAMQAQLGEAEAAKAALAAERDEQLAEAERRADGVREQFRRYVELTEEEMARARADACTSAEPQEADYDWEDGTLQSAE